MAATKEQKEYASKFLKENKGVSAIYLNPDGEWFTNFSYANNSLEKDKEGKAKGKIETFKQGQKIEAADDVTP